MNIVRYNVKKLTIGLFNKKKFFTKTYTDKKMSTTNESQKSEKISKCIVCDADLTFTTSLDIGELLECYDCGTELEVQTVSPLVLIEAPSESEDWGQ